jgi:hypothetical protein
MSENTNYQWFDAGNVWIASLVWLQWPLSSYIQSWLADENAPLCKWRAHVKYVADATSQKKDGVRVISEEIEATIIRNRKEIQAIKEVLRSNVVLETRIAGPFAWCFIKRGASSRKSDACHSTWQVTVTWIACYSFLLLFETILTLFHYPARVLCPIFGWTRGYHDYQFCLPLSAYKNGPPENPAYDALFGTATHPMSFMRNSGFYGTLRSDPSGGRVKSVSDTVVCVADLLQDKGQEI